MKMRCRPFLVLLPLLLLLSAPLSPQTVSVAVFQAGSDKDGQPEDFLLSLGSACMDELFFSGYIATSEKPAILDALEFKNGLARKLDAALEASIAFEILALVRVGSSAYSKTRKIPKSAEYRLIDIESGKILVQGALQGIEDGEDLKTLIDAWCVQASKTIMPACLKSVADRSQKVGS